MRHFASPDCALTPQAMQLFNLLPGGVCMVNPQGYFIGANDFYCRCVGYSRDELLRMRASEITHPDDRSSDAAALMALLHGSDPGPYYAEKRYIRKDGSIFWVSLSVNPVHDLEGRVQYAIAMVREIDDLKKAENALREELEQRRHILDSINEGFIVMDHDFRILELNTEASRIDGRAPQEIVGRTHWEAWPDTEESAVGQLYRRVMRDRITGTIEHRYRLRGRDVWLEARVFPHQQGIAVFFRDITRHKLTEKRIRAEETKFRTIANAMPQMVWSTLPDGYHDYFNQQWYDYTGVQEGATDGDAWNGMFHPQDQERAWKTWRHSLATGQTYEIQYRLRHRSGEYRWVLGRALPIYDESGAIVRWMGTCTDIHDQKLTEDQLRKSQAHLSALLEQSAAGVAESDLQGRLLNVNDRYCEMLRRPREQLLGMRMHDLTHPEDLPGNAILFDTLVESGQRFEIEKRYLLPDGASLWANVAVSLIKPAGEGKPGTILAILFDISERKRVEDQLKNADRKKDEFLAMLAHELRNPLAPISAAANLFKTGQLGPEQIGRVSEVITRQVSHMTGLVDDLLDVSRVTRGVATLEKVTLDLRNIVSDAIDQARPLLESRRHHLAVQLPPQPAMVVGDQKRLVQILSNLLTNAAKYTPNGGHIALDMQISERHVTLTVSDDGIGMSPELAERAFDLFTQAERTSDRSQGGLGIGLALVKSLVELHQGKVAVRSAGPGQGSQFTVRLPLTMQSHPASVHGLEPGVHAHEANRLRVLVVDDNVDAAAMLAMFLEASGHEVAVEHDPEDALARVAAFQPNVCLLDIGLPKMDGNELARRLRVLPETRDALLVAVTGYGQEQDKRDAAEAGFDHHFMKPVDVVELEAVLDSFSKHLAAAI